MTNSETLLVRVAWWGGGAVGGDAQVFVVEWCDGGLVAYNQQDVEDRIQPCTSIWELFECLAIDPVTGEHIPDVAVSPLGGSDGFENWEH